MRQQCIRFAASPGITVLSQLSEVGIRTRDGGRWGVDAVHKVLTRTTYIGRHRFNTKFWKSRERKPEAEVVEMAVPPIIDAAEFEAVQALLKSRCPALTAPRIASGPTLLTGICFCAACGGAMTLRTGESGRYKYYTCCTKARQGETGCKGRTVPMEKLDSVVAEHIEQRLLQPKRLEQILSRVLDRREERAERRTAHVAELRKRAAEAGAKLKRLYDAIENGIADVSDPMLKGRVTELKAIHDQARADAERAEGGQNLRQPGPQAHADRIGRLPPRPPPRTGPAHRSRHERSSHHGLEKRTAAHARRRFKRKNGGFWRAQFCTEVARPKRFELLQSAIHPRVLKETPSFAAITLVAPGERFNAFEILVTPTFFFASDFNSRTSVAVHARLTNFFLAISAPV